MIKTFYFNDLRTACYVLYDHAGNCAIVDPGCGSDSEKNRLVKFVEENNLKPQKIINTHGHFDHVMGNVFVTRKWNIPTYMNVNDLKEVSRVAAYGKYFGYEIPQPRQDVIDIKDKDIIEVGDIKLQVRFVPGHSKGSVALYNEKEAYVISGDVIFAGSIGRTDLPGGDLDALKNSLATKILTLPPNTNILPGHGPKTDVASELATNPFLDFMSQE
ncbi:MAG: MBL fold metallo-hydrolase [Bacteroidales bacterium]